EGSRLDLRFNVDRNQGELAAEATLSGKAGSELASQINRLGQSQSLFAGLAGPDAAVDVLLHFTPPKEVRNALSTAVDDGIRQGISKEKDEAKRALARQFLDALKPTLKSGEFDAGFRLTGPTRDNVYTFVGGIKLRDGAAVEREFRSLVKNLG